MKYDRRAIMQAAWNRVKHSTSYCGTFADALRLEWARAKMTVRRYDVWGDSFHEKKAVKIASNVTGDKAAEIRCNMAYRYDYVEVCIAGYDYNAHRRTA